jgi:hypothetical protein
VTEIIFLWSDGWLLQAIAIASRQKGSASLSEVIEAADSVNHALPTSNELHGGLVRLTRGGLVKEVEQRFALTDLVPIETVDIILAGEWQRGREAASAFLRAESWSSGRASKIHEIMWRTLA